jgi:hypothetical protein
VPSPACQWRCTDDDVAKSQTYEIAADRTRTMPPPASRAPRTTLAALRPTGPTPRSMPAQNADDRVSSSPLLASSWHPGTSNGGREVRGREVLYPCLEYPLAHHWRRVGRKAVARRQGERVVLTGLAGRRRRASDPTWQAACGQEHVRAEAGMRAHAVS